MEKNTAPQFRCYGSAPASDCDATVAERLEQSVALGPHGVRMLGELESLLGDLRAGVVADLAEVARWAETLRSNVLDEIERPEIYSGAPKI
jgi:hypothetical protein